VLHDGATAGGTQIGGDIVATGSTTARSLANRFADVVNVLDYGATGDGTTDDTDAIQNALNAGANKVVYIPSGTYVIDSDGLNIPSSNITIEGSAQTFLKSTNQYYDGGTTPPTVGQGNVINATSVDNITIKNISIIGAYDPAWGNAYIYANTLPNMTDGKKLLFLDQCDKVTLDNFTITNGYTSSTLFTSPEDRVQSIYGFAQVGISRGDDIRLINCNHINSSSEAWSIYDCTNVLVDGCIYDTNYGVSYLDITYCTDVIVTNCQFMKRLISDAGELLNVASSRLTVDSNKFLNGNCDIGNEYLNTNLTIGASFLLHDQTVSNNTLYNGIISCSTAGTNTYTPTWSQENVIISNNTITIDVDTRPAAAGSTVLDYAGISLPRYRNSRNFLITGNSILLKGAMQTTGANPHLYNTIALIDSKLATTGLLRENFSITNNRLMTDITSYDSDDINNSSGAIIFKYGNWENLAIENNYIDAPVGIYIEDHESIDRLSVSGNKIYGESAIVFPFTSATNTDISDLTIADNTFEFWNTSGHTYTSADFIIKGFGFFLTASIGTTSSTMPNTVIKNNTVKCVGLAYISNASASTSIILDLTLDNNDVDFVDYLAKDAGFSVEHLRLGRANSNIEDSTIRLTDNYFVDTTASGLDFNLFAMDKIDFINNVWEGVIALDVVAQHGLGSITDSRYVKKNNMAFGTLTATYNANLGTAVTIIDDGNSGGF
jgi:hypothetical protein